MIARAILAVASRLHRFLTFLFPRRFRARHAAAMRLVFEEQCLAALRTGGKGALLIAVVSGLVDHVRAGFEEIAGFKNPVAGSAGRSRSMRRLFPVPLDRLGAGLIQALRSLRRRPGLAVAATLTLALGIGANTTVFAVMHAVLLRQLPYPDSERLVTVRRIRPDGQEGPLSYPEVVRLGPAVSGIAVSAGYSSGGWFLSGIDEPEAVRVAIVTDRFFDVIQTAPVFGRLLRPDDFVAGSTSRAVIGHGLWQRLFGGDPATVGRTVILNDGPVEIVGILPSDFRGFPSPDVEMWLPTEGDDSFTSYWLTGIARLEEGANAGVLGANLAAFQARLVEQEPALEGRSFAFWMTRDYFGREYRSMILVLYAAVGLVLLIAASNFANLLLVRGNERQQELALRAALGAGRASILRTVIAEGLLLATAGVVVGVALARWLAALVVTIGPEGLREIADVRVDVVAICYAALAAFVVAIAVGLAQISQFRVGELRAYLSQGGRGGRRRVVGRTLVIGQVALSIVLLVGSGLLTQSLWRLSHIDPGFESENRLAVRITIPRTRYREIPARLDVQRRIEEAFATIPGVTAVARTSVVPMSGGNWCQEAPIAGTIDTLPCTEIRNAGPGFFAAMGIRVLAGRGIERRDVRGGPGVAVINETAAHAGWGNGNPLGQRIEIEGETLEIVGVVNDVRQFSLDRDTRPAAYMPIAQFPLPYGWYVLRTAGDPTAIAAAVRARARSVDPNLPVSSIETMDGYVARTLVEPRFRTLLLGLLTGLALVLAVLGVFGLQSYSVSQRTRDIGIRMALGARRSMVMKEVLSNTALLTAIGVGIGLAVALASVRVLESFLFRTEITDPVVYGTAVTVVFLGTLCAGLVPARKATRVDPMEVLRGE